MGELGEVQQQFSFRPAGCQDAEHIADRQPRTPHARLAEAHCGVNADSLKQVHGHRVRGFPGSFRGSMSQRRTRRLRADGGTGLGQQVALLFGEHRQPLEERIIGAVANSTAIETREPVSEIEARLRSSERLVINRRQVALA